jgi:hypothetical protein
MPDVNYLPFNYDELPVSKIFAIDNTEYRYAIQYNSEFGFFTLTMIDENGDNIYSTKLLYGANAFHAIPETLGITSKLIPYDLTGLNKIITPDNFGVAVRLYIV